MTNIEVVKELKSRNKPYEHIEPRMKQSFFSLMCAKIENEMCKPKTVSKFFAEFGYIGSWDNFNKKPD